MPASFHYIPPTEAAHRPTRAAVDADMASVLNISNPRPDGRPIRPTVRKRDVIETTLAVSASGSLIVACQMNDFVKSGYEKLKYLTGGGNKKLEKARNSKSRVTTPTRLFSTFLSPVSSTFRSSP